LASVRALVLAPVLERVRVPGLALGPALALVSVHIQESRGQQ